MHEYCEVTKNKPALTLETKVTPAPPPVQKHFVDGPDNTVR